MNPDILERLRATIAKPTTKPGVRALCLASAHADAHPLDDLTVIAVKASKAGDWEVCVLASLAAQTVMALAKLYATGAGLPTEALWERAYDEAAVEYVETMQCKTSPSQGPVTNVKAPSGVN